MRDASETQEALLAAQNSKRAQQLADVQGYAATIHRSLPDYRFKLSSDIETGLPDLCRRLLESARVNVKSRQRRIGGAVTEALALLENIFQNLESQLVKKLPNSERKAYDQNLAFCFPVFAALHIYVYNA